MQALGDALTKSFIGKIISHAVLPCVLLVKCVYIGFPEISTRVSELIVFCCVFGIYAGLALVLGQFDYFKWYTDPAPDSPRGGGIVKGFIFAALGLLIGAALYFVGRLLFLSVDGGGGSQTFTRKAVGTAMTFMVPMCGYIGMLLSGATGVWNRDGTETPKAPKP